MPKFNNISIIKSSKISIKIDNIYLNMDRNNPFGMPPMMGGDGMPRPMMPPHGGMPPMGMMPQMPLGGFQPQNIPQMDPNAGQPPLSQNANSRTVFVGNIPYDAEDSQLKSLLKLVGPFNTFRLKHDKETE